MSLMCSPNFQGKLSITDKGNTYYNGNAGLKIGATVAALYGASNAWSYYVSSKIASDGKNQFKEAFIDDLIEKGKSEKDILEKISQLKKINKHNIPLWIATPFLMLGCGVLIDKIRNNNAKKSAELASEYDNGGYFPDIESHEGAKYGGILGAAIGAGTQCYNLFTKSGKEIMNLDPMKKPTKGAKAVSILTAIAINALGGLSLGLLTDRFNNNGATKTMFPYGNYFKA